MTIERKGRPLDRLPFYIVEQGLKKNRASEKLRALVAEKMSERAQIEIQYIRHLQKWEDGLKEAFKQHDAPDFYIDNDIAHTLVGVLRDEATKYITHRQHVYNRLMANNGPYAVLEQQTVQINEHRINLRTEKLGKELALISGQGTEIEEDWQKTKQGSEETAHEVDILEEKLANRSHLSSARRGLTRAKRKVDLLRERQTKLRHKLSRDKERIRNLEDQLVDFEEATSERLNNMDTVLNQLESGRLKLIQEQTHAFLQDLYGWEENTLSLRHDVLDTITSRLKKVDILLVAHWEDVASNARIQKEGQFMNIKSSTRTGRPNHLAATAGLSTLDRGNPFITDYSYKKKEPCSKPVDWNFETEVMSPRVKTSGLSINTDTSRATSVTSLPVPKAVNKDRSYASITTIELPAEQPRPKRAIQAQVYLPANPDNDETAAEAARAEPAYIPYGYTAVQSFHWESSEDEGKNDVFSTPVYRRKVQKEPSEVLIGEVREPVIDESEMRILELMRIPGALSISTDAEVERRRDTRSRRPMRRGTLPEPEVADTQPGAEPELEEGHTDHDERFDGNAVAAAASSIYELSHQDIGLLRGIKVMATQDYRSSKKTDLELIKGQVIKQTAGKNEDGFCYGHTRGGPLSPRRYGHYPIDAVAFYSS